MAMCSSTPACPTLPRETKRRFDAVSPGPLRRIVFTQSHPDHIGGWRAFIGPSGETIAQANFASVRRYWAGLKPFYLRRLGRLWARDLNITDMAHEEPVIDRTFHDAMAFDQGGRRFELLSVPGGETLDSLVVWLPDDRIVFSGNMTGPIFGHVPNLYTVRGDKIRSVDAFVHSVQRVIDLKPEVLITGHGEPLRGAVQIARQLSRIRDAAQYMWDRTWEGMNAGESLWALMRDIRLPPELAIPQGHGKVPWIIRAIWEEHVGWFRFGSTTELYAVPASDLWPEIVEMAGGADAVASRARAHAEGGRPLHATHLSDMVLAVDPAHRAALAVRRDSAAAILKREGRENFSEARWLEDEIRRADAALENNER